MDNINDHLKACRPDADVYTYSFTKAEVDEINEGLKKKSWTDEVRELIKEQEREEIVNDFVKAFNEFMNTSGPCGFYEECYDSPTGDCIDCFKEKWLKEQNK